LLWNELLSFCKDMQFQIPLAPLLQRGEQVHQTCVDTYGRGEGEVNWAGFKLLSDILPQYKAYRLRNLMLEYLFQERVCLGSAR
jgi:hypothetical protein